MTKIDRLTPEQEAKLPIYLEKYTKWGHRTEPMDQSKAEDLIAKLYEEFLGEENPVIIYCQSPFQMSIYPRVFKELGKMDGTNKRLDLWNNLWNNLENNLWNNLWNNLENNLENNLWNNLRNNLRNNLENNLRNNLENNLRNNLRNNLENNLRNNLRNNLKNNLWNNLENNLENNLWNNLENNLWNNLRNNLWNNLRNNLGNNLWNNLYLGWYWTYRIVYDFAFSELITFPTPQEEAKFRLFNEISSEIHAISPFRGICFVSDFPCSLQVNEQNRLHNPTGACLEYSDGYSLYAVNGVMIPETKSHIVLNPSTITLEDIDSETNAELKRVMVDAYGQDRYLLNSNAERIHEDDFGILFKKQITGDEDLVMVKVVNSTPEPDGSYKDYFIRVPPNMSRAKEAVAWTFGLTEEEYNPCVQT